MLITVDYVNLTEGHRLGSEPPCKSFTEDLGQLYRFARREWGRCTSKVYVDVDGKARPIGWVFLKRKQYDDSNETFLLETWVTLLETNDTVIRTPHYRFID